ncbi:hypothetical protein HZH66_009560 [Vespula vulgaris]|uniref:Uncharacterized protein n=1 Tax=Vespula vulgaris TaxID=7454 RepID=A0A834MZF5_VESVU|nr:hypothetical protein HZH66_009560 [Vespula vulgaris]
MITLAFVKKHHKFLLETSDFVDSEGERMKRRRKEEGKSRKVVEKWVRAKDVTSGIQFTFRKINPEGVKWLLWNLPFEGAYSQKRDTRSRITSTSGDAPSRLLSS